ncbi:MAG: Bax inhibitor-1/YccA family protein [Chloroflexi bacterium]|nr:Bax inhibitor-1/YccA family protein [Chloroflexota bacterium]
MNEAYAPSLTTAARPLVEVRPILRNVYLWMTLGLVLTAVVAYATVSSRTLLALMTSTPMLVWGIFFLQLLLVGSLGGAIFRLPVGAAIALFLAYAALNGFSLSLLVLHYGFGTLVPAFVTTAVLFAAMTVVATTTSLDLTRIGTYLFMALIGLIIAMFVNLFVQSAEFDLVISALGVIVFTALTASDTQKIVRWASDPNIAAAGEGVTTRLGILGALTLYLNFLNLFIFLVRIFGRSER